jgi:hypothetical protein
MNNQEPNINLHPKENEEKFYVKCNVCGHVLEDWIGSTPCCGSIAYTCDADGGNESKDIHLFGVFINNQKP